MTEPRRTAIEAGLVARVAAGVRYIVSGVAPTDWFGPMQPLPPAAPPAIAGRSFDFPVGANNRIQPRPDEAISFSDLRGLADGYDLLRCVIETRKDQIAKLDWTIRPRDSKKSGVDDPRLKSVDDFLTYPDREHDFETWLRLLLEDLLVIDASTLYLRRDGGGALYALEVVDGATIKRVIDERGRTPMPPDVAYQQVLKGIPAIDYTTDELIYRPRNPRPHKIYGYSPVEQVVMTVNVALRRQVTQLQYYTEGNVPEAMIGVPEAWSPDQIRQFQEYWDSLLEGNTAARRHAKFVPAGMKPTFTREPTLKDEYDEWLARVICFAFSVAPTPFVRDNNRATAQTTRAAALTEGLTPLLRWVKRLMDEVIVRHLGFADLEFVWNDEKDDDPAEQARINDTYVRAGIKSVDEVRTELGLAPVGFGNAIYTGQGAVPLKDVAKDQAAPEPAAKIVRDDRLAKYSSEQPRVAAGNPDGGQWTSAGDDADGGAQSASPPIRQAQEILPFFARPPVIVRPPIIRPLPPLEDFPTEPARPPGPGWEWKGKNPTPGSREGNWYKDDTGESLHPEMDHKPPVGPHWDYRAPDGNWYRWFPDGRMEPKPTIPPVPATPVPGSNDELRA